MTLKMKEKYEKEAKAKIKARLGISNEYAIPKLEKININFGLGESATNAKTLENAIADLVNIAGQKPVVTRAKKSIATFKLREEAAVGLKVTLRKDRMYHFLSKLINVALPRVRDFHGLSFKSFDGRGNYSFGLKEQLVFPEIKYDKIDAVRGMDITICTTARTNEEAKVLLEEMGFPFRKPTDAQQKKMDKTA
ncbi:MAG: 50S ribosomal protein L5 [Cyanobacteria bacterium]|nr:50S ribosomal protein L5 [Cyanobacteriota bacterium]MDA1020950.1 50S ribosomal protein L5 [Cyanobacteriota bacterium]